MEFLESLVDFVGQSNQISELSTGALRMQLFVLVIRPRACVSLENDKR